MEHLTLLLLLVTVISGTALGMGIRFSPYFSRSSVFRYYAYNLILFNLLALLALLYEYAILYLLPQIPETVRRYSDSTFLAVTFYLKWCWLGIFLQLVGAIIRRPFDSRSRRIFYLIGAGFLIFAGMTAVFISPHLVPMTMAGLLMGMEIVIIGVAWLAAVRLTRHGGTSATDVGRHPRWSLGIFFNVLFPLIMLLTATGNLFPDEFRDELRILLTLTMLIFNAVPTFLIWRGRDRLVTTPAGDAASDGLSAPRCEALGITPREREIVRLVMRGYTNNEIADELFISLQTVKDHNRNIFRKTGVRNRVELVNLFRAGGESTTDSME